MGIKNPPIYLLGDTAHEEVVHLPLFEIFHTSFDVDINGFDAIVFTSKNSVKALDAYNALWKRKACYAIGEGTAGVIEALGGKVVFTCKSSYGDHFAEELIPLLKGKKIFFPRAKEVVSPLYEILFNAHIAITQAVVYENRCKRYTPQDAPLDGAILIFTAPSSVRCFEQNFSWDDSYKVIAIGQKTAAVLPSHINVWIPEKQTIGACVALAKQIRS